MKSKRPQQKTRREKRRFRKKAIYIFISIFVIILTGIYVMNHDYLKLEGVEIKGQKTLIATDVEAEVETYLSGKYLWLLPRSNIFLFNKDALEQKLSESFPKISDINVSVDGAETVVVTVGERSAHSLWCVNQEYENIFDEECYFADEGGLLYAQAPYFSGNIYLKFFIQPFADDVEYIGTYIKTDPEFRELFVFLEELEKQLPLKIERVYFDEFEDVRIQISRLNNVVYPEKEVFIYYNEQDKYETILRNIGITLDFKEFKDSFRQEPEKLESIDVRFDGRVFYTFTPIDSESE